ncbi:MAG: SDR family oxidoreductase [Planctomycetes bacterium]|nr:SDR family oxidoreductase [Planctomycetota bacterium]MBL7041352.1 SDR family oxidoreductase [Pirellulaceae bacterium]
MHDSKLEGKAAIITGAGRGIGRSIAHALARKGVRVALAARSADELETVREEIETAGGKATCFPTDTGNEQEAVALVRKTVERFGRLDVLVNNAGMGVFGPLVETSTDQWDEVMRVNARGPFILCREAIPHLRKQTRSYIVNISSVVGVKGYENQSAYAASKHALMGMTKALAREVRDLGIRVHAICPGGVDTRLATSARPDLDTSVLMQPDEIADAVLFLVTREGNAVVDEIHLHRESSTPWA